LLLTYAAEANTIRMELMAETIAMEMPPSWESVLDNSADHARMWRR
jgi:hypothetical protein